MKFGLPKYIANQITNDSRNTKSEDNTYSHSKNSHMTKTTNFEEKIKVGQQLAFWKIYHHISEKIHLILIIFGMLKHIYTVMNDDWCETNAIWNGW